MSNRVVDEGLYIGLRGVLQAQVTRPGGNAEDKDEKNTERYKQFLAECHVHGRISSEGLLSVSARKANSLVPSVKMREIG